MNNQSNNLINMIFLKRAENYLHINQERFTNDEKQKFLLDLKAYLSRKDKVITDEVFDFLVAEKLISNKPRTEGFIAYLISKYSKQQTRKILDIGAGRLCPLSTELGKKGFSVTAMDPKIRLNTNELKSRNIKQVIKKPFYCDEFSNIGTNISNYDLLVGLEPCDATEHIIRQGLKYDKPFEVSLCYQAHQGLDGKIFATPEDWYAYLRTISSHVDIVDITDHCIAYHK